MQLAQFTSKVKKETMDYTAKGIRYICETFKNRAPGTQSERDAQEYMAQELRQWADEVDVEEFSLHPNGFMGWTVLTGLFMIVAVILPWIMPELAILSMILGILCAVMFIGEFILYRPIIDFLFPKKISKNVMARRKPEGEVKRRIIFGGHADAAFEWTWSLHGQIKTLAIVILGGSIGLFGSVVANIIYIATGTPSYYDHKVWMVVGIIELCFIPTFVMAMLFTNWRVIVDGANDNLTACFASMAVLKEMAETGFRFENTEVCCLITGSEEAGLRGAKAYAKKHAKEIKETETVFVSLDTIYEMSEFAVYTVDETGTVHNCEAVADLVAEAGDHVGIKLPRSQLYPGSVDAAAFSQAGLMSAGLCAVNHNPQTYYHTRKDSWDNINPEAIEKSMEICKEAAILYDQKGGIRPYLEKWPKEMKKFAAQCAAE